MSQRERRIQRVAVGLAVVAVAMALVAVVLGAARRSPPAVAAGRRVAAGDVVKLVPPAAEQIGDRVRVIDGALARSLGLAPGDTIVAISGRRVAPVSELAAVQRGLAALRPRALFVELLRAGQPVLERWELDGDLDAARRADPTGTAARDPLIASVRRLNDVTYEVPRSTLEAWTADPSAVTSGGRGVAVMNLGQPNGFKLYAIRPSSAYAALGLQNGDTVRGINGAELDSADKVLELVAKSTTQITVDVTRRGQALILNYLIK